MMKSSPDIDIFHNCLHYILQDRYVWIRRQNLLKLQNSVSNQPLSDAEQHDFAQ